MRYSTHSRGMLTLSESDIAKLILRLLLLGVNKALAMLAIANVRSVNES